MKNQMKIKVGIPRLRVGILRLGVVSWSVLGGCVLECPGLCPGVSWGVSWSAPAVPGVKIK